MIIIIIITTTTMMMIIIIIIIIIMGRKNSSALGVSLSRDGVSIKTLVGGNHKTQYQIE